MEQDSADNPTMVGLQYYNKQEKTSEGQFKSRHRGPTDPLTHQGTKSTRTNGASKCDNMLVDALLQGGASRSVLKQVLRTSDGRLDVVCNRCGRFGFRDHRSGHAVCLTRSCAAVPPGQHPGLTPVSHTFVLLKAAHTLDAAGLLYRATPGPAAGPPATPS